MDEKGLKRFTGEDDDSGKQLKRWKTWAMAKMATMKDLKKEQRGPWLFTLLEGRAWDCCEHFTLEQLSASDGEQALWQTLEDRFPEKEATDLMGEALGEAFSLSASEGESIKQWCARVRETFDRCKRRANVAFPEAAKGWIALHCAGLSEEQKAIGKAKAAGKLEYDEIAEAIRSCFPNYKASASRSKKTIGVLQVDNYDDDNQLEELPMRRDEDDDEETFKEVEAFLADHQELPQEPREIFTEKEAAEALMVSWKQRRQEITSQQQSRKFGPRFKTSKRAFRVDVEEIKKKSQCRRCLNIGHWERGCRNPPHPGYKGKYTDSYAASSSQVPSAAGYVQQISATEEPQSVPCLRTSWFPLLSEQ